MLKEVNAVDDVNTISTTHCAYQYLWSSTTQFLYLPLKVKKESIIMTAMAKRDSQ